MNSEQYTEIDMIQNRIYWTFYRAQNDNFYFMEPEPTQIDRSRLQELGLSEPPNKWQLKYREI